MNEIEVPLQELQEIGDRYSPRVLRSFLRSNGFIRRTDFFHIGDEVSVELSVKELPLRTISTIRRLMIFTATPMMICCLAGTLAFSSQPHTWENVSDLTAQYDTVMAAMPDRVPTVLFVYAVVSSVIGELVASFALPTQERFTGLALLGLIAGFATRLAAILDCIALVIIYKATPQLALIGSPAWAAGIGMGLILVPLRTLIALVRKDHFEITNLSISGTKPAPAVSLAAPLSPRRQQYRISDEMARAVSSPPNHLGIRRVCHAALVFDWHYVSSLIVREFAPIPLQTDLLLMASTKAYFLTLGHQLLVLPVKAFFAYDVAPNFFVLASIAATTLSFVLTCTVNAVPLHKDSIDDLLDSAPDPEP